MGLEDERKMLTGSGDPKEVRQGDRLGPLHCPEAQDQARQNTRGALLALDSPLEFARSGFTGSLDPAPEFVDSSGASR